MQADDEYEYRVIRWRHFENEKVQEQIDELIADGWEVHGEGYVKAGMLIDLSNQRLRRKRLPEDERGT
ncbi:hypothetical protein [Kordiimonas sp.]|uniref:hypothetical protein n=1 Tax=Kordiimonas sp. TaxID=1970157 RepID=UPI003B51948D